MTKSFFTKTRWLVTIILLLSLSVGQMWATTTYKLTAVTSVSAGNKYVFVEDGHALIGSISSKKLQSTSSYNTTSLEGTESYVWVLETATNGFYIKNPSASNKYLNNKSSDTEMQLGTTANADWTFSFSAGKALIQNSSNSNRFIGETSNNSYEYKAYANTSANLSAYAHDIYVYRLDEEAVSCSNYSFLFLNIPFIPHTSA